MSEKIDTPAKKSISPDWLVRGILTKIGETFDRLTGRNWKPTSSLATSELIDRLKKLLDAEVKDLNEKGKFVPHNIKLKMQWDKFSTDADESLKKLEHELLTAAVDHINDQRYHTFAPMKLEITPDYFTEGVKLLASFDKFAENESEAAVNVTVPDLKNVIIAPAEEVKIKPEKEIYAAEFTVQGKTKYIELGFADGQRLSVGRTKENDLSIDDASVSKIHAALVLNAEKQLMVADTGSTNGTFINNQRIAYGKAIPINAGDQLKFGTVEVVLRQTNKKPQIEMTVEPENTQTHTIVMNNEDFEKMEVSAVSGQNSRASTAESEIVSTGESPDQANASSTEPRIVLDFGEKK